MKVLLWLNNRSRVKGDFYARFCERLRGRLPGSTRFVLMGKTLPAEVIAKLKTLLDRTGLTINETKTRQIDAKVESFNFLGFTVRYDKDLKDMNRKYWNIIPSTKSEQKIRDKIKEYLATHGHYNAQEVAIGLNTILRGWLNYFDIPGISYPAMSKRRIRHYLFARLNRYYKRKSQRKCRLYGHNAFEVLTTIYGLIDPTKYTTQRVLYVNAYDEFCRKAVCGKTARTV